jgi:uncharacterized protein
MAVWGTKAIKVKGYNLNPAGAQTAATHRAEVAHSPHTAALKLNVDSPSILHAVTGYGDHHVSVDGRELRRSLLLLPDQLDPHWGPDDFAALAHAHLEPLARLRCDVLLLGTGNRQRFPSPALLRPLIEAGRNIEVMDTQAACRTYNILMTEGRVVAAALIIEISSAP